AFKFVLEEKGELALQYGPNQGYGPLIDYLRDKIWREEGQTLERPQIMLSGGASQALDHCCSLFSKSGDSIIVEAPSYHESLLLFKNHGLSAQTIPVDEEGMNTEMLKTRLKDLRGQGIKPSFIYTIPTYQNPSGLTLSEKRRNALLEIANQEDILIIEDDVYCDLSYEKTKLPTLFALDEGKRVIRFGSFSKIIAPGLRLGWILGPEHIIKQLIRSGLRSMGGGANPLTAIAMAAYCRKGLLEPHIVSLKKVYKERRDVLLAALESTKPAGVSWIKPAGGFFVWITLPHGLKSEDVKRAAKQKKIYFLPGDPFFAEQPSAQHLRLSFSYVPPDKIREGIKKLSEILISL
ncbi:MAG: PLP-dependent aminotransferase family protein, partial [Desulfobacterales bacterium]|nr:PLP-dependent aminotransferase family protein [Desulfobacterales bacterium]